MDSYLEQNKTLSKEEKHFNANFLIKSWGKINEVAFLYGDGEKIKAQTGSDRR